MPRHFYYEWEEHWRMPIGKKPIPVRVCSPEGDSKNCGVEMIKIEFYRRDEDTQRLSVYICPTCDSYDAWPRST